MNVFPAIGFFLFIIVWAQHCCLNNKNPPDHPGTVQLSSVQISQFSAGHSAGCMEGLFRNAKTWGKVKPVWRAHWWQCKRIRLQKPAERGEDVWNEHFTACSYNMYCMCCTCKRESGAQIWYKGLLENITWNIQFVCFFPSTVLFEYLVLLLINVKRTKNSSCNTNY